MGVPGDLSEIGVIDVTWSGTRNWGPTLSRSSAPPFKPVPSEFRIAKDFTRDELFRESKFQYHGYELQTYTTFRRGEAAVWTFTEGFDEGSYGSLDSSYGEDFGAIAGIYFLPSFLQGLLDEEAADLTLEDAGDERPEFDVVNIVRSGQRALRLFFDQKTGLFSRMERPHHDELQGRTILKEILQEYRKTKGMLLPTVRAQ